MKKMYKPVVSLETGTVIGHMTNANSFSSDMGKECKGDRIFYRLGANEWDKLRQSNGEKYLGMTDAVIVLKEEDMRENEKSLDSLVQAIEMAGYKVAFRLETNHFLDILTVKKYNPSFIMIASNLIDRLENRLQLTGVLKSIVLFGQEMDYSVVAEGIRTERELREVMNMGITYAQGKLFTSNMIDDTDLSKEIVKTISKNKKRRNKEYEGVSLLRGIGDICKKGDRMRPGEKAKLAYEFFENNTESSAICLVNDNEEFAGLLTRRKLMHAFGGRYGYDLHLRNTVIDLINENVLIVYKGFSIETVSRLAMERNSSELYDPVVVLNNDKYYGIVTVKDLLSTTVSIEVEKANESNPLTSLPGNKVIEQKIHQLVGEAGFFAIMYLDLDNFKAFNDAYGFPNGDRMIEMLAQSMQMVYGETSFLGHVGGDDFVIITKEPEVRQGAERLINNFKEKIQELYNETDWKRGYIIAESRKGEVEEFPIASVSVAVVTNQNIVYNKMTELTEQIVTAKKKAKKMKGNSIVIL